MGNVVVIGNGEHRRATCVKWDEPFPNIEEFDSMIIDLTSFPTNKMDRIVISNLKELQKTQITFMKNAREIFCIIDEPVNLQTTMSVIKKINRLDAALSFSKCLP